MIDTKPLVYFISDFGSNGPYTGQVEAVIHSRTHAAFIDLLNNAPSTDPYLSSYLINAIYNHLPHKEGFLLSVVDPGVGGDRNLISFQHENMTFMGPDNGLLSGLVRNLKPVVVNLHEKPQNIASTSFHARDWFAPELCRMINNEPYSRQNMPAQDIIGYQWKNTLYKVIYIDHYGNLVTGINANQLSQENILETDNGNQINYAETFSKTAKGKLFWYRNSMGLIEIAGNGVRASRLLEIQTGATVKVLEKTGHKKTG